MADTSSEVIITSSSVCSIYDANNSNEIISYKDNNTFSPKTLSLIGEDYLIGAYTNKPLLKVWTLSKSKKKEEGRFVVPGIVSALSVSRCGNFCIAAIAQHIYVWEVSSGELLTVLARHYQNITVLKFTADDSRFFSGGKDGHVLVWVLCRVIDVTCSPEEIKPHFVWDKHSAEITDIYCGNAVSRVATTSLDMTCKIFELQSGILLTTISMDAPLTCVVMDTLENFVFLGDERGYLYSINIYERLPHVIHAAEMDKRAAQKIHDAKIISLCISDRGTKLMTASEDRTLRVWAIQSLACLLKITFDGVPTNAFIARQPECLSCDNILPNKVVRSFQKEFSDVPSKKIYESNTQPRKLSLLYEGCPDKMFGNSLFCGEIKSFQPERADMVACEETMQQAINGQTVSDLSKVNQQMFSFSFKKEFDNILQRPSSPT